MNTKYLCDPSRNAACGKAMCFVHGGPCGLTDDVTAAARDLLGNPIKAIDPNLIPMEDNKEYATKKKYGH